MRIKVIVGEEISCKEGHILALFINKKIPAGLNAKEAISSIRKQNGIVVASHPLYITWKKTDGLPRGGIGLKALVANKNQIDALETVNGTPLLRPQNLKVQSLNNSTLSLPEVGGSDAHMVTAIGAGYTTFKGRSINELRRAIENGQTKAHVRKGRVLLLLKYGLFLIRFGIKKFFRLFWL